MPAYFRLLVKDRLLALKPMPNPKRGWSKAKAIGVYIGFALLFLILYAMVVALEYFVFQGFAAIGQPEGALAAAFLLCTFIVLFLNFLVVFSTLFFSKDIGFVSALPISSRGLLAVKLLMIALGEAGVAIATCLPIIVMYGMYVGAGFGLYLKLILFLPFLPVLPMTIVTMLSFFLIRISALWKRRDGITTIVTLLFVTLLIFFQMNWSMSLQEEHLTGFLIRLVLRQSTLVDLFVKSFPPIGWLCRAMTRSDLAGWGYGLLYGVTSTAAMALGVWLLGGQYQPLAIKQSEALARLNTKARKSRKIWRQHSPLQALYLRELKEIITVPVYATNCLAGLILFPIMIVVAFTAGDRMTAGFSIAYILQGLLSPQLIFLIYAAVLSFSGFANMAASTSVSREGRRRFFSKIIPVPASTQLLAKLFMGLTLNMGVMMLTAATALFFLPATWPQALAGLGVGFLFSMMSCALGVILDTYHPRLSWKNETEAIKRNANGAIAMFATIALLGVWIGGGFGLITLGLPINWSILLILFIMAMTDIVMIKFLIGKASKAYLSQEKFS